MKKILQVLSCFQYGGTEAYVMNNLRNIDKSEFQFDFWIAQSCESQFISSAYINEIKSIGGNVFYGKTQKSKLAFMQSLSKHISENGPYDAIHSHVNIANSWVMIVAYTKGINIRISHSHATSGLDSKYNIKHFYHEALRVVINIFATKKLACSQAAGNYLYGSKYFSNHGEVVNNGIDINKFIDVNINAIAEIRQKYNIKEENFVIGNITRFDAIKNPGFSVDVFNELHKKRTNSILILGGVDGGQLSDTIEKVKQLGIEEYVRFIGVRKDINVWLHIMDAYILPSLNEGLGIALLEAQAAGLLSFASEGVSNEVDVGLGLVYFLDLSKGPQSWANYIDTKYKKTNITSSVICSFFEQKGYSINTSIKRIEEIYKGEA
jgi:glycosyltransferase EpsF